MTKRAILEFWPDIRFDLSPLQDGGLRIVGSLDGGRGPGCLVRLVVEGDALPDECIGRGPLKTVCIDLTKETYGLQSIVRLSRVYVKAHEASTSLFV